MALLAIGRSGAVILASFLAASWVAPLLAQPVPDPPPSAPASPAAPVPDQASPPVFNPEANASLEISAAVKRAAAENRRALIVWGADDNEPSRTLHHQLTSDSAIQRKILYEYDVVYVDIGDWDNNLDLAASYGANVKAAGLPSLTFLSAAGQVITNIEPAALEAPGPATGVIAPVAARVLDLLEKHQAPYLAAESILADGLARAAKENKNVFLHFGAPWCGWCHRLENWLAQPDIHVVFARDFVDVKIDTDRTIGGADMFKQYTTNKPTGIPWFAFLRSDGAIISDSMGPDGKNIGCPYAPEEITHWTSMLSKAARTITKIEIAAFAQSLTAAREAEKNH